MNVRLMVLSAVVAATALFAMSAKAHDPREFDRMMSAPEAKALPATCAQLDDAHTYSNDVANPDTKALKARCDAEKKAAAKPKATTTPAASKTR